MLVTLCPLFVCTVSLSTYKILIPTPTVKKRANAPLDPTASHSLRSFVKRKLELVGKNADGERETEKVIIINIYIPLLLYGKIYTVQPSYNHEKISVRDARLHSSHWSLE